MKILFKILIFIMIVNYFSENKAFSQSEYKIKKVVIDAGHGGKDPGALGISSYEKDIALAISLKLGQYIKENYPDIEVIYTRTTDVFIELHKRSQIANQNKADLFISVHINSSHSKNVTGTSTFVMGLNKIQENLDVAKKENSVILIEDNYQKNYEGYDPNSPESDIILSLYQNAYLNQSISLADKVQKQFAQRAKRGDRGVRQAGLVVLWNCSMPGILVEVGFISNKEEENFMKSEYGQVILASAIYRAFKEYKTEVENGDSGAKIIKIPVVEKKTEQIIFKVQIAYSPTKIEPSAKNFKGIEDIKRETDGTKFRYTVGKTSDYNEILSIQTKVREKIPDAYVIAFKNNIQIPVKQAVAELNKN